MIDTREYISNLGMPEKVTLFKELYNELAGYGIDGDTELAHVNTFEASLLKSLGGSGTINDITGLTEYKGGGGQQQAPPTQSTVTQTSEFPEELKPFIKDVLGEGQAEFVREKEEGFQAFPGPQLAQFTPEQQAAFTAGREQFTGLAGTPLGQASTYYQPALAATALGTAEIGTEDIQRRMDPFLQNVVDIAKREARRDEDVAAQQRAAQAVGAGSFGGSRQAIVESEAERNLGERLADIQARGLSASFQNAQQAAEAQRAREMTGGRQFAALGDTTGARARSDIAGLAGIGETQQQRSQQALDIAQREFEQERAFPQAALQRYASLIRGFPLQATQQRFATQTVPTPSFAQTLIGGAGQGAALYGMMGGFKNKGGLVSLQGGGQPGPQFTMGNVGGYGTTPRPRPEQSPPVVDATRNQEQQITALNAMQQRGAALRNLAKPQSNISPMNIRNAIVGSGVLPGSRRMASEGGLMSIANRWKGHTVGGTDPYQITELPPLSWKEREWTPEEIEKGIRGPRQRRGQLSAETQSYIPYLMEEDLLAFPRGDDLKVPPEIQAAIEKRVEEGDENNPSSNEDPAITERIGIYRQQLETLRKRATEYESAMDKYGATVGGIDTKLLEAIGGAPDYYKQRQEDLSERRKREQFGNIAQFFARLGTSTAPAAQVGGFRGLLGAAVAAGEQTIPEAIATEAEYAEQEDVLSDKLFDSNIRHLSATRDIAKDEFDRGTEKAKTLYEMAEKAAILGVDLLEAENERDKLLNNVESADINAIRKHFEGKFAVSFDTEGKIFSINGEPLDAELKIKMNEIERIGLRVFERSGGSYTAMDEAVAPLITQLLQGTYVLQSTIKPEDTSIEVEETDIGGDVSEKERVTTTTGSASTIADDAF